MGGIEGQDVLMRLTKSLGPVVAGAIAARTGSAGIRELNHALRELPAEDLAYFTSTFAKYTEVVLGPNKAPTLSDIFDDHFAGKYLELLNWLKFCVELNFEDFFTMLLDHVKGEDEKPKTAESPST